MENLFICGSKVPCGGLQTLRGCQPDAGAGFVLELLAVRVSGWKDEGWDLPSPTQEPLPQWGAQDPCPPPALPMQGSDQSQGDDFHFHLDKAVTQS